MYTACCEVSVALAVGRAVRGRGAAGAAGD